MATRLAVLIAAVVLGLLFSTSTASAAHVQCGDVITQDTVLDSDIIDCPAPQGWAIQIRASGVSLDLNGHTVDGTGTGFGISMVCCIGVTELSVFNGRVQQFQTGVLLSAGGDHVVRDLVVAENFLGVSVGGARPLIERVTATGNTTAINISDSAEATVRKNNIFANQAGVGGGNSVRALIEGNRIHDNDFGGLGFTFVREFRIEDNQIESNGTYGITLTEVPDRNVVAGNVVSGNGGDGIVLDGFGRFNLLERNRTDRNGDDGIDVDAPANTLTRNTANRNVDLGIEAVPDTIDGGQNKARHNGNPAQCVGVTCK